VGKFLLRRFEDLTQANLSPSYKLCDNNANAQRQNLSSSGVGSSPSISSVNATSSVVISRVVCDFVVARRQASEKKYLLRKYVTKKQGQGSVSKASGGGNVIWICNFCNTEYKSTYYRVKGHLLGLACGLGACKAVSVEK
jgi:hypothetical protein